MMSFASAVVYCPELPDVGNANKSTEETHYGLDVTYSCVTGYQFPESNHIIKVFDKNVTCQANETWTEVPDACEGKQGSYGDAYGNHINVEGYHSDTEDNQQDVQGNHSDDEVIIGMRRII